MFPIHHQKENNVDTLYVSVCTHVPFKNNLRSYYGNYSAHFFTLYTVYNILSAVIIFCSVSLLKFNLSITGLYLASSQSLSITKLQQWGPLFTYACVLRLTGTHFNYMCTLWDHSDKDLKNIFPQT